MVTVPTLGFGIRLRGPSTLPNRPTTGIMSGVAMQRSNSILPPCTVSIRSSAPTMSAPAASASSALAPRANTATRTSLPVPLGRPTTPRTIWSAWRGSTPRFIEISTVSSNFAFALALISATASSTLRFSLPANASRAARVRFPSFAILLHLDAHGTRGAEDDLHRSFDIVRVQVLPFRFGDLAHLLGAHGTGGGTARGLGTGLQLGSLLEVIGRRRRLDHHVEGLVLIVGNHGRARGTRLHVRCLGVERLAEFHDVDAALTQCGADGRAGVGLPGFHLQLERPYEFLGHVASPFGPTPSGRAPSALLLCGPVRWPRPPRLPRLTSSGLFCDLCEFQFDRGLPAKDRHRHLQALIVLVDIFYHAVEILEGALVDLDLLAHLK